MDSAAEYAIAVELSELDRTALPDLIENLVRDTPKTTVAVARMEKILEKAGPIVSEVFRTILTSVITEAAKKQLWPGP